MIKKIVLVVIALFSILEAGCNGESTKPYENIHDSFIVVKHLDSYHDIIADEETGYEYYESTTHGGYYVIGGQVLDSNGKPIKYNKENDK
jgi:hypothetical protein